MPGAARPIPPRDRHEAGQPHLAVSGRELRLAAHRGVLRLALAGRLGLAEAVAQLAIRPVARDRGLDLARRALRRDRLERHRHRAHDARAAEQRVHEHRRDLDARPARRSSRSRGRRRRCGSGPTPRRRRAARRCASASPSRVRSAVSSVGELRAGVGVERGPQRARELTRAERAQHGHLGCAERLGHALGLRDRRLPARRRSRARVRGGAST